jgi:hypothetical protein
LIAHPPVFICDDIGNTFRPFELRVKEVSSASDTAIVAEARVATIFARETQDTLVFKVLHDSRPENGAVEGVIFAGLLTSRSPKFPLASRDRVESHGSMTDGC